VYKATAGAHVRVWAASLAMHGRRARGPHRRDTHKHTRHNTARAVRACTQTRTEEQVDPVAGGEGARVRDAHGQHLETEREQDGEGAGGAAVRAGPVPQR